MSRLRHGLAALALLVLVVPGAAVAAETPSPSPSTTPTVEPTAAPTVDPTPTADPTPTTAPSGAFQVTDAQLRWGVNDESNNRAFAPGTFNFLSAGEVPDPGSGGNTIRNGAWVNTGAQAWSASTGNVRVEKRTTSGSYAPATFAGLSTQADGTALGGPAAGTFSGHQVVVDGGTGVVDPSAGTATVQWSGTFTVLYYSGMSFFTVTDPRLDVTPTTATLRGTLGGYASDMVDTSTWVKVAPLDVTLADLPRSSISLSGLGFNAVPAYLGVQYDASADGTAQIRTGPVWGTFPPSFVNGLARAGSASYFYSSGGAADAFKVAKALTISYSAGAPVVPPAETGTTGTPAGGKKKSPKAPSAPAAPSASPAVQSAVRPVAAAAAPVAAAIGMPPAGTDPLLAVALPLPGGAVPTVYALTSSALPSDPNSGHPWKWWTGTLLLLGAAGITLTSSRLKGHS